MFIKEYIQNAQNYLLKQDFIIYVLRTGIFFSLLFILLVQLEAIFYFYPITKQRILLTVLIWIILVFSFWSIYHIRAKKNQIKKYKPEKLAIFLGKTIFSKKNDMVLNALQLENSKREEESKELTKSYIDRVKNKLGPLNLDFVFTNKKLFKLKITLLILWIGIITVFFFNYEHSANAFYRLANPQKNFPAPKPFSLLSMSGNIHIIGGEKPEIYFQAYPIAPDTLHLKLIPIQVSTQRRDSLALTFSSIPIEDGVFKFKLPELFQDYSYQAVVAAKHFWQAWGSVTTINDTIFVTDRPAFESFSLTTIPPTYSKLNKKTQKGNIAMVEGLKGSKIQIDLISNRILKNAYININDKRTIMSSDYNKASGYFNLIKEGEFTVNIVDKRGITNKDPIPFKINIIPDYNPSITVIQPNPITELGNNQTVPINLEINDDYGFTNLQLAYEIRKPTYLNADPYVSMFNINDLHNDSINQKITMFWDLTDMFLMPDDEVHFHFELTDNDNISGPKKTISNTFIARVPSIEDLYNNIEKSEENIVENLMNELDEIENLRNELKNTKLKMLKSKKLSWDEKQSLKNTLEQSKKEIENLEKIAEAIETISNQAEKHKLFSPSLIKKFQELSKMISEIIPDSMLNNMENLQMSLENIDIDSLQEALNNLSEDIVKIEEDLDRYLEIFRLFQTEQKLDEIQNRMEKLIDQQNALNNDISKNKDNIASMGRLAQEEQRNLDEYENILSLIEDGSELIQPFNENSAKELSDLSQSELSEKIQKNLNSVIKNLSSQDSKEALIQSENAMANMDMIMQQLINIQQKFNQQSVSEKMAQLQTLLQNILYLSSQEEQLRNDTREASRNSPRLREYAQKQQLLQDQLKNITEKMLKLSNETFAITPDIGRGIGKANANMEEAKTNLTDRNVTQAGRNHNLAMEGLNEAALGLFNSMQTMQESGSASGFQQLLEMMQQMSGQQQGLNQKGMQLSLGQMAAAAQQQMIEQMLNEQKGIKKSLEELIKEMRQSGQNSMGDLNGIANEMDDVIKDLQKKQYNRKTKERQQRILSRMLDSQASLTQRGQKDERKSKAASQKYFFEGPGGLPLDLGQRENLALKALKKAMNAGYSREHQSMIKKYFNSLSKLPLINKEDNNESN